jgi:acyl phosphate:glycerol-3-phosphate acyltransferase
MIWGLLAGLVVGSLPTALILGRWWGIDLLREGTANPGTNNARQLGGAGLGVAVLLAEIAKGSFAVWVGSKLGGVAGAALAGGGATLGNVYNPWLGFRGGKGLAITAGTLVAAWPALLAVLVVVIGVGVALFRRSGPASLIVLAVYLVVCIAGTLVPLPGTGLVEDPGWMLAMAVLGIGAMAPKHLADTITPLDRPRSRR